MSLSDHQAPSRAALFARVAWVTLVVAVVLFAARAASWGPSPRDASTTEFSARRAAQTVRSLASSVGRRESGTPNYTRAALLVADELRAIPGVTVESRPELGASRDPGDPSIALSFRAHNVVAHLAGRRASNLLVTAHLDAPPRSPGAADNGSGVAVAVEVLRALASSGPHEHGTIVVLTDGEETGLFGARTFARDPRVRSAIAVINLDAGGASGRSIILRAGPRSRWLVREFAASAPYPHGSVIVQQLLEGDILHNVETDARAFYDERVIGLDFTAYEEGYPYHTRLDTPDRLDLSLVQHQGDNVLAFARRLVDARASSPPATDPPLVFYDFAGRWMAVYEQRTAGWLALFAIALTVSCIVHARRKGASVTALVASVLVTLARVLSALVTTVGCGVLLAAAGRPHAWFARPWWLVFVCCTASALGASLVSTLASKARKNREPPAVSTELAGSAGLFALVLALATVKEIAAAYMLLWWCIASAIAAHVSLAVRRRERIAAALVLAPAALLSTQTGLSLLLAMTPRTGHIPTPFSLDPAVFGFAAIVVAPVVVLACLLTERGATTGAHGRFAALAAALTAVGLVVIGAGPTFTVPRPRRILLEHRDLDGERPTIEYRALDFPPLAPSLPPGSDGALVRARGRANSIVLPWARGLESFGASAEASGFDPPSIVVEASEPAGDGLHRVRFRVRPGSQHLDRLVFAPNTIVRWNLGDPPPADRETTLDVFGVEPEGRSLEIVTRDPAPRVRAWRVYYDLSPSIRRAHAALPPWIHTLDLVARGRDIALAR